MGTIFGIIGLSLLIGFAVLFVTALFCYFLFIPYIIAKNMPITDNLIIDCILSYTLTWCSGFIGNTLYLLIHIILKHKI